MMLPPPMYWADETAHDFFSRLAYPVLELLPSVVPPGLRVGETLEILGETCTGKTTLLMECCAHCILPAEHGGQGAHAVVIDSDGGFTMRLSGVLAARLRASGVTDKGACDAAVAASLTLLRVMTCHNADEMMVCLGALRCELEDPLGGDARPRLLLLDNASTFRYADRLEQQHGGLADDAFEARLSTLLGLLRRQQLSIVWSRRPDKGHQGGLEFPIIDRNTMSLAHAELSQPSLRVRLRRLENGSAPPTPGVQLTFQTMLDVCGGPVETPMRREMRVMRVTTNGVMAGGPSP